MSAENLGFLRNTTRQWSGLLATPKTDKHRPLSYQSLHAWYWLKYFFAADLQSTVMVLCCVDQFLADRTNGRAIGTVLRLSSVCLSVVCNVMYCG